ncbi:Lrp/AsnC ligand binding domain-containing protein [Thiolinea disciformis]|uniref:Lrp/AsnC ligand binding domain-containing protein n=1 Tax=Thiolinea disciformis TaxID=125614 RepID=UPI000360C17F|nr:Lrp/AsnC ligand binding domain-containing protein [Thiolinea disciformis]
MNNRFDLFKIRAERLAHILDTQFKGSKEALALEVGCSVGAITHYLNPHSARPCVDKAAKRIERALNLEPRSLSEPLHGKRETYYVAIHTNAQYTYEIVTMLKAEECVKECAAVLGDFDIFIKVQVENFRFLDTLLAKLVKLPGVKRSHTYKAIESLHWQREQDQMMDIPPKNERLYIHNGVADFIYRKLNHLFDEIKILEEDPIVIKDNDLISIEKHKLLDGTKKLILATHHYHESLSNYEDFLEKEKTLIQEGVKSRRIIVIPNNNYKINWPSIETRYNLFQKIGCEVRLIVDSQWINSTKSPIFENFIILDSNFVCIRSENNKDDEDNGQISIHRNVEIIKMYIDTFNSNWKKSHSYEHFLEKIYHLSRK